MKRTTIALRFSLILCMLALSGSRAPLRTSFGDEANWPQWRGPGGSGVSTEKNLPDEWSEAKNVQWKTAIPGRGHSSPIIWGKKIFLTTSVEGPIVPGAKAVTHIRRGVEYRHPDSVGGDHSYTIKVLSLDRETGKILWERTAYEGAVYDDRHRKNTFGSATPVTELGTNALDQTIAEMVKKIAQAPLVHQPGTMWEYGLSIDVLARLVEVVSGKPYDRFLEERIFKPLGMVDTGYTVPPEKASRFSKLYAPAEGGSVKLNTSPAQTSYLKPAVNFGGGSQLVSTASDYLRFCQMLLNGGELDGVRILSRKSVELMSADHLGDMPRGLDLMGPGYGFGLTVAVSRGVGRSGAAGSTGEYYWGGAAGTRFWIDPKEKMIGIFMIQILPHTNLTYGSQFRQLAYQAIVD